MLKTRKRWISLLVTLAFLVAFAVPYVPPVAAATQLRAATVPTVSDGDWQKLGTVYIEVDGGVLSPGDEVTLKLPEDLRFFKEEDKVSTVADAAYDPSSGNWLIKDKSDGSKIRVQISTPASVAGKDNEFNNANELTVEVLDDNEFTIAVANSWSPNPNGDAAIIKIEFPSVYVEDGYEGDVKLVASAPSGSGFMSGEVVIARVSGGELELSVVDVPKSNSDFDVKVRINEAVANTWDADDELKLTLPKGFEWDESNPVDVTKVVWGTVAKNGVALTTLSDIEKAFKFTADEDELKISLADSVYSTPTATNIEFTLHFAVEDVDEAQYGDVIAEVSGDYTASPSEITLGTYGEYGVVVETDKELPTLYAGQDDQELPDIKVKEILEGSLVDGRVIYFELPPFAKWEKDDLKDTDWDAGARLVFKGLQNDDRTAKFEVDLGSNTTTTDEAELKIKDAEVKLQAGATGDLVIKISGSAGIETSEITVAKVVAPVSVSVDNPAQVKIGVANQAVGDVVITETTAGAIDDEKINGEYPELRLDLPAGVSFATVPNVEVIEGNLSIDEANIQRAADDKDATANNILIIPIKRSSTKASKIKVSGINLTLDRTVPEGDILIKVKGEAVVATADAWPNNTTAAQTVIAKVITPAPGETKGVAVFKIGQASYTLNGATVTMDVAPYIKDGRTMVPVRFAANAVGVSDANILWDAAARKVTVLKGDRVVQMTIGSNILYINGAAITMDVAPEIKDGRTMLPIRFLGQALGAEFIWDEATQTVTVNF